MAKKKAVGSASPSVPDESVLCLDATLTIQNIEQFAGLLRERLTKPGAVTIDLSRVANVDTAGIQVLLAFRNEAPSRGLALEFRGQTAALTQALGVLGLQGQLAAAPSHATQ
jgi:anti-anti-sigma regulatory factor